MAESKTMRMSQALVTARLSRFPLPHRCHPLHIHVHNDDYSRIFGHDGSVSSVLALERVNINEEVMRGTPRLFVTVRPGADFGPAGHRGVQAGEPCSGQPRHLPARGEGDDCLVLYCTEKFLNHYRFGVDEEVLAQAVVPFHIDKMVVGVASKAAYDWAQKTLFSTGLLVAVCDQRVLVRSGDVLLVPFIDFFSQHHQFNTDLFLDMRVLECEPLKQGILSVNTEIVIVDQTSQSDTLSSQNHGNCSVINFSSDDVVKQVSKQSMPVFSDFASSLLQENIIAKDIVQVVEQNQTNPNKDLVVKNILPVKVVTNISSWKMMAACDTSLCEMDDIHNVVGLSEQTVKKLGLFAGSLVRLQPHSPKDSANKQRKAQDKISNDALNQKKKKKGQFSESARTVVVKVFGGSDVEEEFLHILPSLMINIFRPVAKRHPFEQLYVSLQKFQGSSSNSTEERSEPTSSCSRSWQAGMDYASEVHVALIYSPDYSPSANCSVLLKHYFQRPRLIKKGDVISISATEADPEYCSQAGELNERTKPVVHFKVMHTEPQSESHTFLVDVEHSVLFQDGATNNYVPVTMTTLMCGDDTVLPPPGQSTLVSRLVELMFPLLLHRRAGKERMPSVLVMGPAGCGKTSVMRAVAARLHMHLYQVSSHELCGETPASTEARIKTMMHRATTYAPCIVLVRNIHVFGKAADGSTEDPRAAHAFHEIIHQSCGQELEMPVVVVATTSTPKHVNSDLADKFLHQVAIEVPSEGERYNMLADLTKSSGEFTNINITHISQRTAGLVLGDLYALMSHVRRHAHSRIMKHCLRGNPSISWESEKDIVAAGICITQDDFEAALDRLQAAQSDAIGAPKIPQVAWSDVGGLAAVKAEILDTIQLPLNHPELLATGLRRSGVLLYGPPGTGKTLLAKAVATECSLNFLSVKGPELINMYVGQSEENVREVFSRARSATPCVIFFDELDSLAPNRGRSGDSGGVMDRVVSQLLAELDGLNKGRDVFVIGATNRPDLLDPALQRPGRFDKLLYLGVSSDRQGQLKVIKALTRKFLLSPGWTLDEVVGCCPFNMTGADFYALCSDAMLNTVKRSIELLENGMAVDQTQLLVDKKDFMDALETLVPSVSEEELQRYTNIQAAFANQK